MMITIIIIIMKAHNNKYRFESPVVDKGTIEIKRDIVFQANNMLLFVLCMVQLTMILRKAWLDTSLRASGRKSAM